MPKQEVIRRRNEKIGRLFDTKSDVDLVLSRLVEFIQALGKASNFRASFNATASVFFRRFYLKTDFGSDMDPRLVALTCAYLACKVEEYGLVSCDTFITRTDSLMSKPAGNENFADLKFPKFTTEQIVDCEMFVVDRLQFDLVVFSPYRSLREYISDAGLNVQEYLPVAWSIVNDSLRADDMWLIYPPHIIGLAAIYIATIYIPKDIRSSWFDNLNVDIEEVREAALDLAEFYRKYTGGTSLYQSSSTSSLSQSSPDLRDKFLRLQNDRCLRMAEHFNKAQDN